MRTPWNEVEHSGNEAQEKLCKTGQAWPGTPHQESTSDAGADSRVLPLHRAHTALIVATQMPSTPMLICGFLLIVMAVATFAAAFTFTGELQGIAFGLAAVQGFLGVDLAQRGFRQ